MPGKIIKNIPTTQAGPKCRTEFKHVQIAKQISTLERKIIQDDLTTEETQNSFNPILSFPFKSRLKDISKFPDIMDCESKQHDRNT